MAASHHYLVADLRQAARNLAREVGVPPSGAVLIASSLGKAEIAAAVAAAIEDAGLEQRTVVLGGQMGVSAPDLGSLIRDLAGRWGLVLLLEPEHAVFLFEAVGRPDRGIKIPTDHLVCDWLISPASLVSTYRGDADELRRFRQSLLSRLRHATSMRVTTRAGTDIRLALRAWVSSRGEVATAPVEGRAEGVICVDGCAYSGPPAVPFALLIERGRVVNVGQLDACDDQQRTVAHDLTRDENANVLAELGIGTNLAARWDAEVMESEQARGTCHFGFGHNLQYGGQTASRSHFDLVVRCPTIFLDSECICAEGEYTLSEVPG